MPRIFILVVLAMLLASSFALDVCKTTADCQNGYCSNQECVSPEFDKAMNLSQKCFLSSQCQIGYCNDGYCIVPLRAKEKVSLLITTFETSMIFYGIIFLLLAISCYLAYNSYNKAYSFTIAFIPLIIMLVLELTFSQLKLQQPVPFLATVLIYSIVIAIMTPSSADYADAIRKAREDEIKELQRLNQQYTEENEFIQEHLIDARELGKPIEIGGKNEQPDGVAENAENDKQQQS